jgi:hypothetical protein
VEGGRGAVLVAELFDLVAVTVELVQIVEADGDGDGGLGREAAVRSPTPESPLPRAEASGGEAGGARRAG